MASDNINPVSSIIVVGGGSSGWMCAACLNKLLPDVAITLIDGI